MDFSRDGRILASASGDATLRLWDTETNQQIKTFGAKGGLTSINLSANDQWAAAGCWDRAVNLWNTDTNSIQKPFAGLFGHTKSIYAVAFSCDSTKLLSGSLDNTIKIWDLTKLEEREPDVPDRPLRTLDGHGVRK